MRGWMLAALFVVVLTVALGSAGVPSVTPAPTPRDLPDLTAAAVNESVTVGLPTQAPSFAGAYVVDHGQVFAYLGYAGFANLWYGVGSNGTQVFADGLYLLAYDLESYPVTLTVDVHQVGFSWLNQSIPLSPNAGTGIPIGLNEEPAWTLTHVDMGGVTWSGYVSTPVSLLPLTDWNLGGLDLMVMAVLSEAIIAFSILTWAASRIMRFALFARKFSLIVWGHVFLGAVFVTIITDYQWIDQTFAGWSPFLYITPLCLMWFLFCLSLFNRTQKRECLQLTSRANQELLFGRFLLTIGRLLKASKNGLPAGTVVLIDESWRGFWARVFGHHVGLESSDPTKPAAFVGAVRNLPRPTSPASRSVGRLRARREGKVPIENPQDDGVDGISFVKAGVVPTVRWPKLSFHRAKTIPAHTEERKDGTVVQVPEQTRPVLSWPHYIEGDAEPLKLEPIHFRHAIAVSAEWLRAADLARMLGETQTALYITRAEMGSRVEAEVESRLLAYFSLLGRTYHDKSPEETRGEASRFSDRGPVRGDSS